MDIDHEAIATQHLLNTEEIFLVLRALQLHKSLITVVLPHSDTLGSSLVLDVQIESQTLIIDQPNDEFMGKQLAPGQKLVIRAAYGGIQVSGIFTLASLMEFDSGPAIELHFPNELMHRQRRAAFRVNLTAPLPVVTLKSSKRDKIITGTMTDISVEGLSIAFEKFVRPPITPSEFFEEAQFHFNNSEWLLAVTAKHPNYDPQTDLFRCGFSFHRLTQKQSKAINQWVLKLQRDKQKTARHKQSALPIEFPR